MVNEIQLLSKHMTTSLGRQQRNEKEKKYIYFQILMPLYTEIERRNINFPLSIVPAVKPQTLTLCFVLRITLKTQ